MSLTRKQVLDKVAELEAARQSWDDHWQDVSDYVCPDRGRWAGRDQPGDGGKRMGKIVDSTATRAHQILAAGLMGGLTSPAKPWFRLGVRDDALREADGVRAWLYAVEQVLYAELARSNFYQCAHALYLELGGFASACMFSEASEEHGTTWGARFHTYTAGEFSWACDHQGRVNTVAVRREMTLRQIADKWGEEKLPPKMREKLKDSGGKKGSGGDEKVEVVRLVLPRADASPGKIGSRNMPWALYSVISTGADDDDEDLLEESGFNEFPFLCPRWDVTGSEKYGRGPGMTVLPDVKMLQEMAKGRLQAVHLGLRPPMRVPSKFAKRLNLVPGGQNYVNPQQADGLAPLYEARVSIAEVTAVIEDVRNQIRSGFFNDLFLMISSMERSGVTATEIMEKQAEKLLMLGPIVERLQSEFLGMLIIRLYRLMERQGRIPRQPRAVATYAVQGGELVIEYVSMLSQAQKLSGAQSITQLVAVSSQVAQTTGHPEIMDKIDLDQAVDDLADIMGTPADLVRSDGAVADIRQSREQQAQQAAAMQQGMAAVQAARDLSGANMEGRNALTELRDSVMQGGPQ
ncbi:Bacteriophage head-to-tail connecting protein [Desulfovibrio sp. X2]|uniref:portal protein n=1 Tax=Desulfovibrio sp. X2 TaxID=941449 RepID=UPI000358B80A|nr:portal protein [Desulfovibrio sp. X2]EPR42719.1 Bacteriophage head-to-tail connecting protein [Desulfovibrio sp. X2]